MFIKPEDLNHVNKLRDGIDLCRRFFIKRSFLLINLRIEIKRLHNILTSKETINQFSKYENFSDRLKTFFNEVCVI
jgi:hypothetical protein